MFVITEKIMKRPVCNSVNHTRFPKEDHLPDWARRDNKVKKGDRVEYFSVALETFLSVICYLVSRTGYGHKLLLEVPLGRFHLIGLNLQSSGLQWTM